MPEKPKITVAMMTRNRSSLLQQSIRSVLAQEGVDLDLVILDNASTDDTPEVVRSIGNPRIEYIRHPADIGILRNWNRAIRTAAGRSPVTCIFHDDDLMLPGYLAETASKLVEHPSVGFSLVIPQFITADGTPVGEQDFGELGDGIMPGLDFLQLVVDCRGIDIYPPSVLCNSRALLSAGPVDSPHMRGTADMNLYYRLAARWDVLIVRKVLVQCRQHGGSDTALINRSSNSLFWYGAMAERIDAAVHLLRSERVVDPEYRRRLADRILALHRHQSAAIHPRVPEMYHTWENRIGILGEQIGQTIPPGVAFILVDRAKLGIVGEFQGRRVIPFLELDGMFWGSPASSQQAIAELQRLKRAGAAWLVLAWPCFWWLDHYGQWGRHLDDHASRRDTSPHAVIYELHD